MTNNGPFGIDPEDFDRFAKEASDGLRDVVDQVGKFFGGGATRTAPEPPKPTSPADGVWAIYTVSEDGAALIDQLYATELDALRAHKDNTDPTRKVRFLPYGVSVSVLED
ncbi:hypothetical protein DK926_07865 [Rhodococcus sp. Eu-32]|uniref:hypothetical protein n=1 Tax=Rhodococcus sp. Eu-32 TaxID=1017319 RepID=UPI000DF1B46C|nr:hypothetical protein [Rhodococcus sp. Eu-32]RRQ28308.1 hypothetical protein DK926_07865 [Rhodococcus sp. Eu-32]